MINVGRCTKIALTKEDKSRQWLAEKLGVSYTRVGYICNNERANSETITRLAKAFGMREIDFLELDLLN